MIPSGLYMMSRVSPTLAMLRDSAGVWTGMTRPRPWPELILAHTASFSSAPLDTPSSAPVASLQVSTSRSVMVAVSSEAPSTAKGREPTRELLPGHRMTRPMRVAATRIATMMARTVRTTWAS